jgi:hypothetical protein
VPFDEKIIGPFFTEEPAETGDSFLVIMDKTALYHVPVGTSFQSDGAPLHFPSSPDLNPLDFFFGGL